MKVLVATEKPFAVEAVEGIRKEIENVGNELVLLEKYTETSQLLEAVKDVDALIVRSDKVTKEILDAAVNLKIVVRAGAGYDSIDTDYARQRGVVVENTPGQNSNAVAELVILRVSRTGFCRKCRACRASRAISDGRRRHRSLWCHSRICRFRGQVPCRLSVRHLLKSCRV